MTRRQLFYSVSLLVLLCRVAESATQGPYRLSKLADSEDAFAWFVPSEINSYGQVAAEIQSLNYDRAVLWTPDVPNGATGSMVDVGLLPPDIPNRNRARGVNSYGQVAGFTINNLSAFLWTPTTRNGTSGTTKSLESVPGTGAPSGFAEGINESGQVAGQTILAPGVFHAFLWTPSTPNGTDGSMIDLGTLPGGTVSRAWGINALGQVAGESNTTSGSAIPLHAFLWNPLVPNGTTGTMVDLGELPGGFDSSTARRINSRGQVIGESEAATGIRAFLWTPTVPNGSAGAMIDLGDLPGGRDESQAFAINAHGHVVGTSSSEDAEHAFLWVANSEEFTGGTMIDLNSLLSAEDRSRWTLRRAQGINDLGQIVGTASFDADGPGPLEARPQAFLLMPIPEPSSVVLACLAACCFSVRVGSRQELGSRSV